MSDLIYYYILLATPYEVQSTDFLDELVSLLYEEKADFITESQRAELGLSKNYFRKLRTDISKYEEKIPLYDIASNHIFLIDWKNVYTRIHFDNYRIVNKNFYDSLKKKPNPGNADKENLRILSYYDLDVLNETYMKIFYKSFLIDTYITDCRRPSFYSGMEHILPYYSINEMYYLAYDWNLTTKLGLTEEEINDLCMKISTHDIPAQTLLDHQLYIYDSRAIGLVKHYSLFGSYYMNRYLRKNRCCIPPKKTYDDAIRNFYLENQIKIMIRLVIEAPAFTKDHSVYRFVETDDYLRHLNIGDIYQDSSFMSTTRNPFYYKENYAFGYILIKINLPKNIKGIGLCIEAYSNFPKEEEIVLPPTSKYRLDALSDTKDTTKIHNVFNLKVQKKYEFTWAGNDYIGNPESIVIDMPGAYIPNPSEHNLMDILTKDENIGTMPMANRLKYFRDTYTNINNQFESVISGTKYTFNLESYDSTKVYELFFFYEVPDGIMITTANPRYGNINILMEIGTEIHVNYYFKYSVTDPSIVVDLNRPEWIEWFALLAYVIGSKSVVFHSNYILQYNENDTIEQKLTKTRYTFSQNIYLYLKDKKKFYQYDEVTTNFDYALLDYLFVYPINDAIKPTDKNELYRIAQVSGKNNMGDFYIYVIENYPKLIKDVEAKMDTIFEPEKNPFNNISYTLAAWRYLLDRKLVSQIPSDKEFTVRKGAYKKLIGDKKIPKFQNRLRTFMLNK